MPGTEPQAVVDSAAFHATPGVEDWRILGTGPQVRYRCDGLPQAAAFACRVAALAGGAHRQPEVDVRPGSVTVRIRETEEARLATEDVRLAQAVQSAAREDGLVAQPCALRSIQIAVAHAPGVDVRPFWRAVLGYEDLGAEDAEDPARIGPPVWFHEIEHGRAGRGRTHVDVYVPAEEAEAIVDAALAAGGRIADDSHAPSWWTLASPDNHGVDVAPWPDRG